MERSIGSHAQCEMTGVEHVNLSVRRISGAGLRLREVGLSRRRDGAERINIGVDLLATGASGFRGNLARSGW